METILRKYTHLSFEEFGQIAILALRYSEGKEIDSIKVNEEIRIEFEVHMKKELDVMLYNRNRMRKGAKK